MKGWCLSFQEARAGVFLLPLFPLQADSPGQSLPPWGPEGQTEGLGTAKGSQAVLVFAWITQVGRVLKVHLVLASHFIEKAQKGCIWGKWM